MSRQGSPTISPVYFLSALLLILGTGAAWYVRHLYSDLSRVLKSNVASVRAAEELEIALRQVQSDLYDLMYRDGTGEVRTVASFRTTTDRWLQEATLLATTSHEQEIIGRLSSGYRHFFAELEESLKTPVDGRVRTEIRALIDTILTKEIIAPAHEYLDYNESTMLSVAEAHSVFSDRISLALLAIGICGCAGGFIGGLQSSRRMRRSMVELNLPLSLAAGKLSEVVGPIRLSTSLDLGELKRILEAIAVETDQVVARLQKSQQEVMRSEKLAAIGQLAAGTAHEIRNPLMSIKLLVQAALAEPAHRSEVSLCREDLQLIDHEICRLEKTIRNLLDFARPPILASQMFPLERLVSHCVSLVSGRARLQNVRIEPDKLVVGDIEGDYAQLQQVLLNFLLNSLDAMPRGGVIRLSVKELAFAGEERIELVVADEGQGIPERILPSIFEPFTSSKDSGTGLGLSISKQIVEAHRGEIFAGNRREGGARVGFTLPKRPMKKQDRSPHVDA